MVQEPEQQPENSINLDLLPFEKQITFVQFKSQVPKMSEQQLRDLCLQLMYNLLHREVVTTELVGKSWGILEGDK